LPGVRVQAPCRPAFARSAWHCADWAGIRPLDDPEHSAARSADLPGRPLRRGGPADARKGGPITASGGGRRARPGRRDRHLLGPPWEAGVDPQRGMRPALGCLLRGAFAAVPGAWPSGCEALGSQRRDRGFFRRPTGAITVTDAGLAATDKARPPFVAKRAAPLLPAPWTPCRRVRGGPGPPPSGPPRPGSSMEAFLEPRRDGPPVAWREGPASPVVGQRSFFAPPARPAATISRCSWSDFFKDLFGRASRGSGSSAMGKAYGVQARVKGRVAGTFNKAVDGGVAKVAAPAKAAMKKAKGRRAETPPKEKGWTYGIPVLREEGQGKAAPEASEEEAGDAKTQAINISHSRTRTSNPAVGWVVLRLTQGAPEGPGLPACPGRQPPSGTDADMEVVLTDPYVSSHPCDHRSLYRRGDYQYSSAMPARRAGRGVNANAGHAGPDSSTTTRCRSATPRCGSRRLD